MTSGTAVGVGALLPCVNLPAECMTTPRHGRGPQEDQCSPLSHARSVPRTCARRSLFTLGIIALFRLGSHLPTPVVSFRAVQECLRAGQARAGPTTRAASSTRQPLQRRRAAAAVDLRARHHAVHHRDDHRAAAARRHPALRDPQPGGPGRPGEADAVHALPHDRRSPCSSRRRSSPSPAARPALRHRGV